MDGEPSGIESQVLAYNKQAMDNLRSDQFAAAHQFLSSAEQLLKQSQAFVNRSKLFAITYNNQGCFYKRVGELNLALKYLRNALELEEEGATEVTNQAGTLLNICAILSQSGKHEEALQNSLKALRLLQQSEETTTNAVTTLVIAYHNTGVELECLNQRQEAALTFKQGWELAKNRLGLRHPLTGSMKKSYMKATEEALDKPIKPNYSSRGRMRGNSMGSPKYNSQRAIVNERTEMPSSVPPRSSKLYLPNITRSQKKQASDQNVAERRTHPLTEPVKNEENDWFPRQEHNPAPPSGIVEQLMSGNVRFISGVRKQPMHKEISTIPPLKKKPLKPSPPSSKKSPSRPKPKAAESLRSVVNRDSKKSIKRRRKSNKVLDSQIQNINEQLTGLQQKLQDFEGKFLQIKDIRITPESTLDLSSLQNSKGSNATTIYVKSEAARQLERKLTRDILKRKWLKLKSLPSKPKTHIEKPEPLEKAWQNRTLPPIPESAETRYDQIVMIQSHIRRYLVRTNFLKIRNAAVVIQKNVKARQTSKLFQNIRMAAIFIQACFRGFRTRKQLV